MSRELSQPAELELPPGLVSTESAYLTVFIEPGAVDLRGLEASAVAKVNDALLQALNRVSPIVVAERALLKVHVGEPKCVTRMRPEYAESSVRFLQRRGVLGVVAADTTVAYTGPRGHRQNEHHSSRRYLELARKQGWSTSGPAGVPFVVLDRPSTGVSGCLEFDQEEVRVELPGAAARFNDFFLAGGFAAADFVINHAHLTLHGLAGVAGCVKSLAMGCSSLRGKLRMHQSLLPDFDAEVCAGCGRCVESCPEHALNLPEGGSRPAVDPELCIGCGECEAVCARRGVRLRGEEVTDWQRGEDTLPLRMADYTMGLMADRWDRTVHVLHMVNVTERCDCLDVAQKPMLGFDLGFLVGKNPFAMDLMAARRLADALPPDRNGETASLLKSAERTAAYVSDVYGVLPETPVETMTL